MTKREQQKACAHERQRFIGHSFRDRAASIACGRRVTGNVVNGCEKQDVFVCDRCGKTFLRKNKDKS